MMHFFGVEYEKEHLDAFYGREIDAFIKKVQEEGYAPQTIYRYKRIVYSSIQILSRYHQQIDFQTLTTEDVDRVIENIVPDTQTTINAYRSVVVRFISFVTGTETIEQVVTSKPRSHEGYATDGEFRFQKELEHYRNILSSRGTMEELIDIRINHLITCCRIIDERYYLESPADMNTDMLEFLKERLLLKSSNQSATAQLRIVSDFVSYFCGKDLMQELRNKDGYRINLEPVSEEDRIFLSHLKNYVDYMIEYASRPSTIRGRISALTVVYKLFTDILGPFRLEDLKGSDYIKLQTRMQNQYKQGTINADLYIWDTFLKFTIGKGLLKECKNRLNRSAIQRQFIFQDDFDKMFASADIVEKLILALGGTIGLRINEMVNLKVEDIVGEKLRVFGKGHGRGMEDYLTITDLLKRVLDKYLPWRANILKKYGDRSDGYLIVCKSRYNEGKRASKKSAEQMLANVQRKSGISFSSHCLRRYYCTSLKDEKTDLLEIRNLMRHSKLATTLECYIYADPREKDKAIGGINRRHSNLQV